MKRTRIKLSILVCVLCVPLWFSTARAQDSDAALSALEAKISAEPDNLRAGSEYRQMVIRLGEYDRAISFFEKLMEAIFRVHETWNIRISTGRLNRWLGPVIEKTPPPAVSGWRIKIRYMTQPKARPPHFVIFGNQLDELPTSYERFLINGLRESFGLHGVPIRISTRNSKNPFDKGGRRIK